MKIIIEYESSWRNSFLDGDNNTPLPKSGRKFIASSQKIKETKGGMYENFKKKDITHDTVMGVLNRLIGDQRKLYQSRRDDDAYFFKKLESLVGWKDESESWEELVYIRNMNGNDDRNSFVGALKANHPLLNSDYSQELWGILNLSFDQLCDCIVSEKFVLSDVENNGAKFKINPLSIVPKFTELTEQKPVKNTDVIKKAGEVLLNHYSDQKYSDDEGVIKPIYFYCSALYLQLERLKSKYDMSTATSEKGCIPGISKKRFTQKDFLDKLSTGGKKKVYGNPYICTKRIKKEGEVTSMLTKARGKLEINLDVDKDKGQELANMIDCAGVSSFYLGKKGLAYVTNILV